MSRALLDVNVLLALLDADHIGHAAARAWLAAEIADGWASCAITQNGFVRIVSQPGYPNPVSPSVAVEVLREAVEGGHHAFWPCDVSFLDASTVTTSRVHGHRQVTDTYLLALAVAHEGRFVTFDHGIVLATVPGANPEHLVLLT